jgi:hypothetical protein
VQDATVVHHHFLEAIGKNVAKLDGRPDGRCRRLDVLHLDVEFSGRRGRKRQHEGNRAESAKQHVQNVRPNRNRTWTGPDSFASL